MKQPKRNIPDAGAGAGTRLVQVADVMTSEVVTAGPEDRLGAVRALLAERSFHSLPIVDQAGEPVGIVTSTDLIAGAADDQPVSAVMTTKLFTVPQYEGVHVAARIMRNHKIHHLIVTHERKVVGVVSSFDLLRLVEDRRFGVKGAAQTSRKGGKRKRNEAV